MNNKVLKQTKADPIPTLAELTPEQLAECYALASSKMDRNTCLIFLDEIIKRSISGEDEA